MPRKLPSWIDGFEEYMEGRGSPQILTRWAGIFAVAAALERKIWTTTAKGDLYPNLYVVMVGPPGVGKTIATSVVYDMLNELKTHHLAPTSVTKASLMDALMNAERSVANLQATPPTLRFNALTIVSDELGVLLPGYESDFMNVLTNIYDCRIYAESRRSAKINFKLAAPQINLIAATTPSYLASLIPEGAWDQGFMSRVMMIYSGEQEPVDLFNVKPSNKKLYQDLISDLRHISSRIGAVQFSEEAAQAISEWHLRKGPPRPEHPRLHNYASRRTAHLIKLCIVACMATTDERIISIDHYRTALDWLIQAEHFMPDIFKSMQSGGDMKVIEEAWYFLYQEWQRTKKPIYKIRLIRFLSERVPAHSIQHIVAAMESAGLIKKLFASDGEEAYEPAEKRI